MRRTPGFILLVFCTFFIVTGTAQDDITRIAVFDIDMTEYKAKSSLLGTMLMIDLFKPNALNSIPEHLVKAYASRSEFIVIDKANYQLIEDERERQKSEDFIDGYVIAQGKSEGIDFLLRPKYLSVDNSVNVTVYDVASGEVVCEANAEVVKNKVGPEHTSYYISLLLDQLNNACFGVRYHVVRATDSKNGKARELLIGAGENHQMEEKKELEIFIYQEEMVGEKTIQRAHVIGECEIDEVEGPDFSIAKVKDGHEEIEERLQAGEPLYCRTKRIY